MFKSYKQQHINLIINKIDASSKLQHQSAVNQLFPKKQSYFWNILTQILANHYFWTMISNQGFSLNTTSMNRFLLIICFSLVSVVLFSQQSNPSAEAALQKFKNNDYEGALPLYQNLLTQFSKDIKYNYYAGACMVETNTNIAQASKYLRYSSLKGAPKEVYFYLGRANQLSYEFEEAITNFNKYLKLAGLVPPLKDRCNQYIEECKTGKQMIGKIYAINTLQCDTTPTGQCLRSYKLSSEQGRVLRNDEFFESGLNPEGIMFLTERGDLAFYTSNAKDNKQYDLYKIEKLIDGWGSPIELGDGVNTLSDEKYPFLLTDGTTLYFSSNKPGGLGGYDIYKANYNSTTKQFDNVVNMGIPFNSPADDYFFVCDEFKQTAWFTSNRASGVGKEVTYKIKWDDSIVKNNVTDINSVKQAAMLIPSTTTAGNGNDSNVSENGMPNAANDAQFHFLVTDTLEYTQLENFRSEEAKQAFIKAQAVVHQKDSLSQKMKEKRRIYANTNSDAERSSVVNDILRLEKQTYGLDEAIGKYNYEAQRLEQEKIKDLVRTGQYVAVAGTQKQSTGYQPIDVSKIPASLTLFSNDEFGAQLKKLQDVYPRLFTPEQTADLQHADSLYVYGNMLNIESARLLEKASKLPDDNKPAIPNPMKKEEPEAPSSEQIIKQSRELKMNSLTLYHQSLDIKYKIYAPKYRDFKASLPESEMQQQLVQINSESNAYYKSALELLGADMTLVSAENYEKAGTLKRKAIEGEERGFFDYLAWLDKSEKPQTAKEPDSYVAPSYSQIHKEDGSKQAIVPVSTVSAQTSKTTPPVAVNTESTSNLIYKIQIGAFRNEPATATLSGLTDITKLPVPESGLTKYFCGKYKTYNQAETELQKVRQGAFPGAFIVAYLDNTPITISQARELEKKH
jgi:hypothetical protein